MREHINAKFGSWKTAGRHSDGSAPRLQFGPIPTSKASSIRFAPTGSPIAPRLATMARPSWSGHLRFNLISVPVVAYNAAKSGSGGTTFHMLHEKCHSRIKYQKVCPIHGEVPNDEI